MDSNSFATIASIIKTRRSVKPVVMNGNKAPNGHVAALLELADWAPTHGFTEPWRFIVYEDPTMFCQIHADVYKQGVSAEEFNETVYTNLQHQGDKASHVIIAVMERGSLLKIPAFEEVAAVSSAIQNILLGATALSMASFWSTGGAILKPAFKDFLQLRDEDQVMGVLYLGYADQNPEGKRTIPLENKVKWVK
ncbi:nitroreductase family protein [Mucilaginibacter ginsenosidivorax]|uniref:Nitroreductase n=1 Tax=Mucilaginibacter ginsenosidivorax TaxID=862126 RepID=A0A5B8VTC6_9SPHI|nr:nitroreductase [Mucilaginibacter ginsenosidivorax]QEC74533.1 nitroreductase [Mucilaginibacter ginsenosidivorax]